MSNHLQKGKYQNCKQNVVVDFVFLSAVYVTRMFISQLKCLYKLGTVIAELVRGRTVRDVKRGRLLQLGGISASELVVFVTFRS